MKAAYQRRVGPSSYSLSTAALVDCYTIMPSAGRDCLDVACSYSMWLGSFVLVTRGGPSKLLNANINHFVVGILSRTLLLCVATAPAKPDEVFFAAVDLTALLPVGTIFDKLVVAQSDGRDGGASDDEASALDVFGICSAVTDGYLFKTSLRDATWEHYSSNPDPQPRIIYLSNLIASCPSITTLAPGCFRLRRFVGETFVDLSVSAGRGICALSGRGSLNLVDIRGEAEEEGSDDNDEESA